MATSFEEYLDSLPKDEREEALRAISYIATYADNVKSIRARIDATFHAPSTAEV